MFRLGIVFSLEADKMVQLTTEQRTFVVLHYSLTHSLAAVQSAFREKFPDRNPPSKTTILKNFRKYSKYGTSLNLNKSNSGRPRTARSPENIAAIRRLLEENPRSVSARRNPIQISPASFNRITRLDLGRTSYSMVVRYEFPSSDQLQSENVSEQSNETCEDPSEDPNSSANVVIEDERTTTLDQKVDFQNVRQCTAESTSSDIEPSLKE